MRKKGKLEVEIRDWHDERISRVEETVFVKAKNEMDYHDKLKESLKNLVQKRVNKAYANGEEPINLYGKITKDNKLFVCYYGNVNSDKSVSIGEENTTNGEDESEESYIKNYRFIERSFFDKMKDKFAYFFRKK